MLSFSCDRTSIENSSTVPHSFPINTDSNLIFEWPKTTFVSDIIYLETLDSAIISHVEKIWVSKDGSNDILVFDSRLKKIFIFDSNGKVKSVFDKNGSGPGEYFEIRDIFIDFKSSEIHILDNRSIKKYNLNDFRYLGSKDLKNISGDSNFTRFIKIKEVYYLWTNIPPFQRTDLNGQNIKEQFHLVRLGAYTEEFFVGYKFGALDGGPRFYPSVKDDAFYLSPIMGENNVQIVTEAGVFPKYEFPFSAKDIPTDLLEEMFNLKNEFLTSDYFKLLTNFRETNRFLYFNYVGPEAKAFHGLFDKEKSRIEVVGKRKEYIPQVIYSDSTHFYTFISPDVLFYLLEKKGIVSNNTLLGKVDLQKIKQDDNPLIIKFEIE